MKISITLNLEGKEKKIVPWNLEQFHEPNVEKEVYESKALYFSGTFWFLCLKFKHKNLELELEF